MSWDGVNRKYLVLKCVEKEVAGAHSLIYESL